VNQKAFKQKIGPNISGIEYGNSLASGIIKSQETGCYINLIPFLAHMEILVSANFEETNCKMSKFSYKKSDSATTVRIKLTGDETRIG